MNTTNYIAEFLKQMVELKRSMRRPCDLRFFGNDDLVLQHGHKFSTAEIEFRKKGKRKQCYCNAYRLARGNSIYYVEGYAILNEQIGLPLEHAWCCDKTGRIIDPTWPEGFEYFGIIFSFEYVNSVIMQRGVYGVLDNPEMKFPLLTGIHDINKVKATLKEKNK